MNIRLDSGIVSVILSHLTSQYTDSLVRLVFTYRNNFKFNIKTHMKSQNEQSLRLT